MRIANVSGRAALVQGGATGATAIDIATASEGRFGPSPRDVYEKWDAFAAWASSAPEAIDEASAVAFDRTDLDAPVPDPRQVFAIGLNYRDHADEAGLAHPEHLVVFTKFVSSLAGPDVDVVLPGETVDYETELVVVIGREVHEADAATARAAIAGYAVGQDFSERTVQTRGPAPQFSLGKSFPNFAPFGPAVVTLDELADPDQLRIGAVLARDGIDGTGTRALQDGTTADLIFPVERIIADLSQVVTLYPGDIIFTGTPAGVGGPKGFFLQAGDVVTSEIEGLGTLTNRLVAK